MTHPVDDDHLSDLLERAARPTDVGPAPLGAISARAGLVRRRRVAAVVLASAAAVLVVIGGASLVFSPTTDPVRAPAAGEPEETAREVPMTDGRLVGLGNAAVEVPGDWGTNDLRCGVPQGDTVVVDVGGVDLCLTPRPADVDSVEITRGAPRSDTAATEPVTIDGVEAQRGPIECTSAYGEPLTCTSTLYLPSEQVSFRAESSTSPRAVERLLQGVRILSDRVGVPGFSGIANAPPQGRSGERYAEALRREELGVVTTIANRPDLPSGYVLAADPPPGTVVEPGTTITITVAGDR